MDNLTIQLQALSDPNYRAFQTKLMPTVDPATVLGVRTPELRRLAKRLKGTETARQFMQAFPHTYYEEMNLHGFLIEYETDFDRAITHLNAWLPYVNNWATCDCVAPKVLATRLPDLEQQIKCWLTSPNPYTVRYAIGMLQRHFLGEAFDPKYLLWVSRVPTKEYYLHMMVAWYFATALAKQPKAVFPYFSQRRLSPADHNKAIQKALESYRISPELKQQLRQYKISAKECTL